MLPSLGAVAQEWWRSLGTGEWVMGPNTAAKYGGALLAVVPLAIFCQSFLNTEAMRYTLVTGEPQTRPATRP